MLLNAQSTWMLVVVSAGLLVLCSSPLKAEQLVGRVVRITDGDTLTVLEETPHRIRLADIDAPERGQPWSRRAAQALSSKVLGKRVSIEVTTTDRYDRLVGKIWLGDREINREMVREGHAWAYRQYLTDTSLLADENYARTVRAGLWGLHNPVAPWCWRRGARSPASVSPGLHSGFTCSGKRYCHEMRSCAEAMFNLRECGSSALDADNDGIACEAMCLF